MREDPAARRKRVLDAVNAEIVRHAHLGYRKPPAVTVREVAGWWKNSLGHREDNPRLTPLSDLSDAQVRVVLDQLVEEGVLYSFKGYGGHKLFTTTEIGQRREEELAAAEAEKRRLRERWEWVANRCTALGLKAPDSSNNWRVPLETMEALLAHHDPS